MDERRATLAPEDGFGNEGWFELLAGYEFSHALTALVVGPGFLRVLGEHGDEEFLMGTGVGIVLDGGLVDIGLDSAEARRAAPYLLPIIPARFGRPCSPSSQMLQDLIALCGRSLNISFDRFPRFQLLAKC